MSQIIAKKVNIPLRINLLFLIIVLLFSLLILRLAQMQIQDKAFYDAKLKSSTVYRVKNSSPRGLIFDAKGKLLVSNDAKDVTTYMRSPKASAEDIKAIAKKLSDYIRLPESKVSQRAIKDYYLADQKTYADTVKDLPKEKKFDSYGNRLAESKIYNNALNSIKKVSLSILMRKKDNLYF
nr:hypothetical protein [Streptococcus didelphis]